jgi:hypothetical protein
MLSLGVFGQQLAAGTPLTFSSNTLTSAAAAVEAAMVASAIDIAASTQALACNGFVGVNFIV